MATKKYVVGILVLFILTSSAYIVFDERLKILVEKDKSTFYVKDSGLWLVTGKEYNALYKGSSKISRNTTTTEIETFINNITQEVRIRRNATYKNATIVDTYHFRGDVKDPRLFPINHTIEIINGSGLIYEYEVRNLIYSGPSMSMVKSPQHFGRNMKIEWQDGWYWSALYSTGKLKVRYKVKSNYEVYQIRLFDPPKIDNLVLNTTANDINDSNVNLTLYINNNGSFSGGSESGSTRFYDSCNNVTQWRDNSGMTANAVNLTGLLNDSTCRFNAVDGKIMSLNFSNAGRIATGSIGSQPFNMSFVTNFTDGGASDIYWTLTSSSDACHWRDGAALIWQDTTNEVGAIMVNDSIFPLFKADHITLGEKRKITIEINETFVTGPGLRYNVYINDTLNRTHIPFYSLTCNISDTRDLGSMGLSVVGGHTVNIDDITTWNGSVISAGGGTTGLFKNITTWILNTNAYMLLHLPFENGTNISNATFTKEYARGANGTVQGAEINASGGYDGWGAYMFNAFNPFIKSKLASTTSKEYTVEFRVKPKVGLDFQNASGDFCVFDAGSLRACFSRSDNQLFIEYTGNDTTWREIGEMGFGNDANDLIVYNGSLYAAAGQDDVIYRYDGDTTWTSTGAVGFSDEINAHSMAVWNRSLWAGFDNGSVYRYNGGTSWTNFGDIATLNVFAMAVWNGSLYASGDSAGTYNIYRYDLDSTWTVVGTFQSCTPARSLVIWNGSFYATIDDCNAPPQGGNVTRYDGGTTWTSINLPGDFPNGDGLIVFNNSMYVYNGTQTSSGNFSRYAGNNVWEGINAPANGNNNIGSAIWNGSFYTSAGSPGTVSRYNGSMTWESVGACSDGLVTSLISYNGSLYSGGDDSSPTTGGVCVYGGGGSLRVNINSSGTNYKHITITLSGTNLSLYIDGVFNVSVIAPNITRQLSDFVVLGSSWGSQTGAQNGMEYNGTIDEFRIYDRGLSAPQVKLLFDNRTDIISYTETGILPNETWTACVSPNDKSIDGNKTCASIVLRYDTMPNVTVLSPSPNSVYNHGQVVEIAANITSHNAVSTGQANVTHPNGSITRINLLNTTAQGSRYNISFLPDKSIGVHLVTFDGNDSKNNHNTTQETNFTIRDVLMPNVTTLIPTLNSEFNTTRFIEIGATVLDDVWVNMVYANVTFPNTSTILYVLSNSTNTAPTKWNVSFFIPNQKGVYTVTIIANDTSDNKNNTQQTNFTAFKNNPNVTSLVLNSTDVTKNLTGENLTLYYNITDQDSDPMRNITDWRVNVNSLAFLNMPFENGSNSSNATYTRDYSTYGNNGTVYTGWNGAGADIRHNNGHDGYGAYSFDGRNDYITARMPEINMREWTIEFRAYPRANFSSTGRNASAVNLTSDMCVIDTATSKICFNRDGFLEVSMTGNSSIWNKTDSIGISSLADALVVWNGSLYASAQNNTISGTAMIYRYNGIINWSFAGYLPASSGATINTFAVWNNTIYAGEDGTGSAGEVYKYEGGLNWTSVGSVGSGGVGALAVYNNSLYGASSSGPNGSVFRYDGGTTWAWVGLGGFIEGGATNSLVVYNNTLYAGVGTSAGYIYRYDGGTQWTNLGRPGNAASILSLTVWNNSLMIGTTSSGVPANASLFRYDATSNITWLAQAGVGSSNSITAMTVWNGSLYLADNIAGGGKVYWYNITGLNDTVPLSASNGGINALTTWNGSMYAATSDIGLGQVFSYGNGTSLRSTNKIWNNGYNHVVITRNLTHLAIHMDGVENTSMRVPESFQSGFKSPVRIGQSWGGEYYNGSLDELKIYNRSLSVPQIKLLFTNRTDVITHEETVAGDIWQACVTTNDVKISYPITCSSNFTILTDFPPNVTNLLPARNSVFYLGDTVEIAATVVDDKFVSNVSINMTWPNGSTHFIGLYNATPHPTKYNTSLNTSVLGLHSVRVIANDSSNQFNTTETTNFTVVSPSVVIYLDGSTARERKYEYGSNVTISVNSSPQVNATLYIDGRPVITNVTNYTYTHNLRPVIKRRFNDTPSFSNAYRLATIPGAFGFNFTTEVDFGNVTVAVNNSGQGAGLRNLWMLVNGTVHDYAIGIVNGTNLTIDRFSNRTEENKTLTYSSGSTKTIQINISVNHPVIGNSSAASATHAPRATLSLKGSPSDPIELDLQYNFSRNITAHTYTKSFVNFSASSGQNKLTFTLDDFKTEVSGRWSCAGNADTCEVSTALNASRVETECLNQVRTEDGYITSTGLNMTQFQNSTIMFALIGSCGTNSPGSSTDSHAQFQIVSDTGQIETLVDKQIGCGGSSSNSYNTISTGVLSSIGSDKFAWVYPGGSQSFTVPGAVNLRTRCITTCSAYDGLAPADADCITEIRNITSSGFSNIESSTGGASGMNNWTLALNMTSFWIFNTTSPINKAKLTVGIFEEVPNTHDFLFYMSPNNGTNWENVQNGVFHTFLNSGANLMVRVFGNGSSNSTPFAITSVKVDIVTGFAQNLSFDVGQNGDIEINLSGITIDETIRQINLENVTVPINRYIQTNCTGRRYCTVPIDISSDSAGELIIFNMTIPAQLNNFTLNSSDLERHCAIGKCDIAVNVSPEIGSSNTELYDLAVDFRGDANISIRASSNSYYQGDLNNSILVRFSKFVITSVAPFFDFFPQTNNSKNVEPFGQDAFRNVSIFNFTSQASTDPLNIWHRFNESMNSCIALFCGNFSGGANYTLNTTYQKILYNLSNVTTPGNASLFCWLNLTQCPASIIVEDPYSYMEGHCSDCVRTFQ